MTVSRNTILIVLLSASVLAAQDDALTTTIEPPVDYHDPGFRLYVDDALVEQAFDDVDAGLLADVGFQIAEGERILHREHNKLPARVVMGFAVRIATQTADQQTLERIAKAAESVGNEELAKLVDLAMKTGGPSRTGDDDVSLGLMRTTPQQFQYLKQILESIQLAQATNDSAQLIELEQQVEGDALLTPSQREQVLQMLSKAKQGSPADLVTDPHETLLRKLVGVSRGGFLGIYAFPNSYGMQISSVIPHTAASALPLYPGDTIYSIDGMPTPSFHVLKNRIWNAPPDRPLNMVVITPGGHWEVNVWVSQPAAAVYGATGAAAAPAEVRMQAKTSRPSGGGGPTFNPGVIDPVREPFPGGGRPSGGGSSGRPDGR